MKIGDLIKVRHFGSGYNGMIGIVMEIREQSGFRTSYTVQIPNIPYCIGLFIEQCEVINASR